MKRQDIRELNLHSSITGVAPIFVGREEELADVRRWITWKQSPTRLYVVSGIGGVGKTALLRQWHQNVRSRGHIALWVDGRAGVQTPQGFLEHLGTACLMAGVRDSAGKSPLSVLLSAMQSQKVALFIDNFEALSAIEEWISNAFWGAMPDTNLLMVVAARTFTARVVPTLAQPGKEVIPIELGHLTASQAYQLVEHDFSQASVKVKRQLVENTGGHPLALTLALSLLKARSGPFSEDIEEVSLNTTEFYHRLSTQWLREVVDESLYGALEVLALLDSSDQETISEGLGREISAAEFSDLASLSFVQYVEEGLALHDIVRAYLFMDMTLRQPRHIQMLRRRLSAHLFEVLSQGTPAQKLTAGRRLLTLSLDALPMPKGYADLSAHGFPYFMSPYQSTDLPYLRRMIIDWADAYVVEAQRMLYREFLDEFCEKFPQDVRILRSPEGRPMAASFFSLVHRYTGQLLVKYFPYEIRECLTQAELEREPEQSSTYYAILVCVDLRDPGIAVSDVTGLLIRNGLSLLGSGTRVTLVATNPGLKQLLATLGCSISPTQTRNCDVGNLRAEVCTLDLTGGRFAQWVDYLLRKSENPDQTSDEFFPQSASLELDVAQLREALARLQRPDQFRQCVLLTHVPWSAEELRVILMRALTGRDPSVSRFLTPEQLSALRAAYVDQLSSQQASASLNLSRASYFRRVGTGIQGLAYWLAGLAERK